MSALAFSIQFIADAAAGVAVVGSACFVVPAAINGWHHLRDTLGGSAVSADTASLYDAMDPHPADDLDNYFPENDPDDGESDEPSGEDMARYYADREAVSNGTMSEADLHQRDVDEGRA